MKLQFLTLLTFFFHVISPVQAMELKVGREALVVTEIEFPQNSRGVWIQDGEVVSTEHLDYLDAHCWLTVNESNPKNLETGNYRVTKIQDADLSRGGSGWMFASDDGRKFHLQCTKGASLVTRISDRLQLTPWISSDNLFVIKIKTVRKILKGLIEI